jgi:hypothetical protein
VRSNGLTARSYTPVADLDPRLAASLLDDLAARGIAAYTNPVETPTTAGFDRPDIVSDVRDRLYVDAAAADRVSELLESAGAAGASADNEDLTWAQIVAGFDQRTDDGVPRWPVQEDVTEAPLSRDDLIDATRLVFGRDEAEDDEPAELRHRSDAGDASDRFVPPTPPPLPVLEPVDQLAWVGVLGGPLLLLLAALFGFDLPYWGSTLAVLSFIGGFIVLVVRMRDGSDDDWDPDSGAVV